MLLLDVKKTNTCRAFRDNLRAMSIEVFADRLVWQGNHVSVARDKPYNPATILSAARQ